MALRTDQVAAGEVAQCTDCGAQLSLHDSPLEGDGFELAVRGHGASGQRRSCAVRLLGTGARLGAASMADSLFKCFR